MVQQIFGCGRESVWVIWSEWFRVIFSNFWVVILSFERAIFEFVGTACIWLSVYDDENALLFCHGLCRFMNIIKHICDRTWDLWPVTSFHAIREQHCRIERGARLPTHRTPAHMYLWIFVRKVLFTFLKTKKVPAKAFMHFSGIYTVHTHFRTPVPCEKGHTWPKTK